MPPSPHPHPSQALSPTHSILEIFPIIILLLPHPWTLHISTWVRFLKGRSSHASPLGKPCNAPHHDWVLQPELATPHVPSLLGPSAPASQVSIWGLCTVVYSWINIRQELCAPGGQGLHLTVLYIPSGPEQKCGSVCLLE